MLNPGFQQYFFPILEYLSKNDIEVKRAIFIEMAKKLELTDELMMEKLPSQAEPTYINRIGWALTHLKKANLISSPIRGHYKITEEGALIVKNGISDINIRYLKKYDAYRLFLKPNAIIENTIGSNEIENEDNRQTPREILVINEEIIKKEVCDEILVKILNNSPSFFEQLVVDLILAMGYGGSRVDAGSATRFTKDGGVDGIINEDKLGIDKIYIQAKRYKNDIKVGRPAVQQFIGALTEHSTRKGIFITTSSFSRDAIETKPRNDIKVIYIDGEKLVELMYEYNVGVSIERQIDVKKIDYDYFDGE